MPDKIDEVFKTLRRFSEHNTTNRAREAVMCELPKIVSLCPSRSKDPVIAALVKCNNHEVYVRNAAVGQLGPSLEL